MVAVASVLAWGCLSPTSPPEVLLWEGELLVEAEGPADMKGSAAMVAYQFQSDVGVGIESGPEGVSYGWRVHSGTCATPGDAVAPSTAFPALNVDSDGAGEAATTIQRRLTGTEYAVQVVENADGSGAVLACADLTRRT
jgi:hypothetical protein